MKPTTIHVDRAELVRLMKLTCGTVPRAKRLIAYLLGAKPRMGAIPGTQFRQADCSGFVRWLIHGASFGQVRMPDGSWFQEKWARESGFESCRYTDCALLDSRLRIAFISPRGKKIGHVWLVCNGLTVESYGGWGAGRRKWDAPVLANNVTACYVLTDKL